MKLAKKLETEILKVYNAYWDNYLKGNVEAMDALLAEEYTQVGSAETEVFSNKQDAVKFLYDTIDQVSGKLEMRNRSTRLEKQDTLILIHELCDIFVLTDDKWVFYAKARASTLMQQKKEGWKIIHQHSSFPDARTGEGENIAIDKIAEENRELREAVKRRTVELVHKNRELEIEAALEKVRAVAMSMNKPDDLLNVCEILFKEFNSLGFTELRNAMINIHDDEKKSFLNYDYSDEIGKSITPLFYNIHPVIEKQIKQIRSANDAFSETVFKGKDLESWKEFRKSRGEKDDQRINNISALYYYFYSIGTGSIGISTFSSINEEKLELLKRFRNVFDLAYRRYNDIALAEAQAKEAQIELALERVRARTMAMQKSEELKEVIRVVYEQFVHLNILVEHAGFVMDYKVRDDYNIWIADPLGVPSEVTIPYFDSVYYNRFNEAKEKGEDFFATNLSFEEKNRFYQKLFEYVPGLPEEAKEFYFSCPGLAGSTVLLDNVCLYIENFSGTPYSDEENNTLMRFGKVFQQTYTRFLDLQKAEAQAREAQIEAALERVRSRTMAMQKSDELLEVVDRIFIALDQLGYNPVDCTIFTLNYQSKLINCWSSLPTEEGLSVFDYSLPFKDHPMINEILKYHQENKSYLIYHLKDEEKVSYDNIFFESVRIPEMEEVLRSIKEIYVNCIFMTQGAVVAFTPNTMNENDINLLQRFSKVVDLTYTRFLDLQKAEAQAREAEIELALERVRARTMAMHQSSELSDAGNMVFQQIKLLGIHAETSWFWFIDIDNDSIEIWTTHENKLAESIKVKASDFFTFQRELEAWKNHVPFLKLSIPKQDAIKAILDIFGIEISNKEGATHFYLLQSRHKFGFLGLGTWREVTEEEMKICSRFASVFEQTYTRFLDLKNAEAQAREAQIEASLERVRSRTMAMQKSDELGDVAAVLFYQMNQLVSNLWTCGFVLCEKDRDEDEWWLSMDGGFTRGFFLPNVGDYAHAALYDGWLKGDPFRAVQLEGNDLQQHYDWLMDIPVSRTIFEEMDAAGLARPDWQKLHAAYFSKGYLVLITREPCGEEEIFKRFAQVFDLTYTRFLDLQKAEAQAMEAKIELGLEHVRARAMAMHKTDELLDAAELIYKELSALGITSMNISYAFVDEEEKYASYYGLNPVDGKMLPFPFVFPHTETEVMRSILSSWKKQEPFNVIELDEEATLNHQTYIGEHIQKLITKNNVDIPFSVEEFLGVSPKKAVLYSFNFTKGYLFNIGGVRLTNMQEEMVLRFTKVFEMTYRRFLDLKQAEEQAREAKIEVSLERVRSKAMAMHSPDDLSETVNVFFKELKTLGIIPIRCGVGQIDEATRTTNLTTTTSSQQGDSFKVIGKIKQTGHPVLDGIFENWKLQKEYHPVLQGDDIKAYYNVMNAQIGYPDYPEGVTQYGNCFYFIEGFVFAWTESRLSEEELQIFRRFTSVLSLTYRRYLDLKEAEVRAFETVREASLDRVRAEIASMRTAEDLNHITPIIWRELKTLEVPFIRCGVFIIDEEQANVQVYLSTPDGKSLGVLNLPIEFSALTSNSVEYWRKKKVYKEHWSKEQFIKWTKSTIEQRQVQNAQTYQGSSAPPESLNLHFVPFAQGMLYVGDISPLSEEKLQLVKSLAEGFSIAYARYEDFKNLEDAKNRVESTLKELKSAQAQLIHSEKMASLGELTAGIAHEIKNPLNFVNNFSELSRELLDDLKAELENNNKEEVMAIVNDVKQNLEKINQHGKRADSIVKGMLLHSRGTSGDKALTHLNNLLDQYVTLAYHGLRAQDKEFNITIEKDYDESIEKINVVPQDISRVFLNIINNACYASYEKKQKSGDDFVPILKVSTKNLQNKVEIRIRDNGNGIPADIIDKIFQPFFTTKPTGEGTGLGLSLSYDIVTKMHGGELKVETKINKGSEFIIQLPLY